MTEYIKREDVREMMRMEFDDDYADEAVDRLPAADVAPVRHGTWSIDGQCSECGEFDVQNPFGSAYCPHCGAMMEMGDWV